MRKNKKKAIKIKKYKWDEKQNHFTEGLEGILNPEYLFYFKIIHYKNVGCKISLLT